MVVENVSSTRYIYKLDYQKYHFSSASTPNIINKKFLIVSISEISLFKRWSFSLKYEQSLHDSHIQLPPKMIGN